MKSKKVLTFLTTAAVTLTAFVTPLAVRAEDLSSQIESAQQQVQSLQNELNTAEAELNAVTSEIEAAEHKSAELSAAIASTQEKLSALQNEIATLEDLIAKRTEKLQTQARAEQTENTFENYVGIILNSQSIIDAIERFNTISQLVSAGAEMREQQVRDKAAVESKKAELEVTLAEQSRSAEELSVLQDQLTVRKAEKEVYASQVALEKAGAESDVQALQQQKADAEAKAAAARQVAQEQAAAKAAAANETAANTARVAQNATTLPNNRNTQAQKAPASSNVTTVATSQAPTTEKPAAPVAPSGSKGQTIANAALAQLGAAQDCTMLVTNALRAAGINYHNWPVGYLSLGTVVSAAQAQPGDLIYYPNGGMGLAHIAVYIGGGRAVHGGWNGNQTVINSAYVGTSQVFIRVR